MKLCTYKSPNCPRCVQRRCVVGLAPGEESCDCRQQFGKCASLRRNLSPPGIRSDENVDCGSQGENVEDVNVVVSPSRPHMGEVQELKREICTVSERIESDYRNLFGRINKELRAEKKRADDKTKDELKALEKMNASDPEVLLDGYIKSVVNKELHHAGVMADDGNVKRAPQENKGKGSSSKQNKGKGKGKNTGKGKSKSKSTKSSSKNNKKASAGKGKGTKPNKS